MSSYRELVTQQPGSTAFLLGNEAIVRGLLEAGVEAASTYPGTPSSEIGDALIEIAEEAGIRFEFSVNEKVAVETAFAASLSGLKSFVFMKHVGLNVASDAVMSIAYTGVGAPMVIMTADDPSMFSSQNEQDNRIYAGLSHLPMVEPSDPQEAKDFLISAFDMSEREKLPVLFRTTTRTSHMRSTVTFGSVRQRTRYEVPNDPGMFVTLPSNSYKFKEKLIERMGKIAAAGYEKVFNSTMVNSGSNTGIVCSGEAYNVISDVLNEIAQPLDILKIGLINPLPEGMIVDFLSTHETVLVAEEVDPVIESGIRAISQKNGLTVRILGKLDGTFPMSYEMSPSATEKILRKMLHLERTENSEKITLDYPVPPRPPVLCPGCPHRGTYFAVKRAVKMLRIDNPIYSSDIGCYSLGDYEPFKEASVMLSMGSSIGVASGFRGATDRRVISFIGDSTFFHSGIPGLINAVHNRSRILFVIMDNDVTAMTGRQPNPGTPANLMGGLRSISIADLVKSIGVDFIREIDPYDLRESLAASMEALRHEGVSVIIAKRECAIIRDNRNRKVGISEKYRVNPDKCSGCMNCVTTFSCPAMSISNGKVTIDPALCDGCGVCSQPYVCPFNAIQIDEVSANAA